MAEVRIKNTLVGDGHPCFIIAEIGINHNGDVDIAKKLIDLASFAGCNAVKFQKRTIDMVYKPEELAAPRESPFGTTNGDLKYGLIEKWIIRKKLNRPLKSKRGIEINVKRFYKTIKKGFLKRKKSFNSK